MTFGPPELSVILPADSYESIKQTLRHLRCQSARDRIEIVIPTAATALNIPAEATYGFHSIRLIEVGRLECLPHARAQGVRAAAADIVVFAETHAYPDPGYAEAIINAHRGPWAVVGPTMWNANPASMLSWSGILMDYGPWLELKEAAVMDDVPGHNGAYKRSVLLEYGSKLEQVMESDTLLNRDLRSKGYKLYLEPAARVFHLNVSRLAPWILERFASGRSFAALRACGWPWHRRLLYIGGAALIPWVRLRRIFGELRRTGRKTELVPRLLPALTAGLVLSGLGELIGYAMGPGRAPRRVYEFELHRAQYVRRSEK